MSKRGCAQLVDVLARTGDHQQECAHGSNGRETRARGINEGQCCSEPVLKLGESATAEIDAAPSEGIDLVDPVPQGRSAISSRLRYSAWAFVIAMGLVVVGGISLRLIKKGGEDKAKQTSQ